jgi:hypothetical protein
MLLPRLVLLLAATAAAASPTAIAGSPPAPRDWPNLSAFVLDLKGRWSGTGSVTYLDGRQVEAKCIATYFVRADGGELKQNLRCRNERFELDFTGRGTVDGNAFTGEWTENKYNVTGTFSGGFAGDSLAIEATSELASAIITVQSDACLQNVTIAPKEAEKLGVQTITGTMRKC